VEKLWRAAQIPLPRRYFNGGMWKSKSLQMFGQARLMFHVEHRPTAQQNYKLSIHFQEFHVEQSLPLRNQQNSLVRFR
jgi:hypothetical protein